MATAPTRPRYWAPSFDRPHLAIPVLIALVAVLIAYLPGRPIKPVRTIPPAPLSVLPTTILAPTAGVVLPPGYTGVVEGLAQPGSIIRLYWYDKPLGDPTRVEADGRWRFSVGNFPAGQHSLRASAWMAGRYEWSSEVVFSVAAPTPAPSPKAPRTGPTQKPPTKSPKVPKRP
ncbi:MAG TPA: hypothetical protein PLX89_11275 [Verrucomicrobiota bacterium]|nr:hypothetical protein [Verrucomicrobiales bacterium]HRI13575.1 hypothetical protein [Verrucomicrobiota bacterium]